MELRNLFLWAALAIILALIWQQWQIDYGHRSEPVVTTSSPASTPATVATPSDTPRVEVKTEGTPSHLVSAVEAKGQRVRIQTDVLDLEIDTAGADIRHALLPKYPVSVEEPNQPFQLMGDGAIYSVAQSGLVAGTPSSQAPNHHAVYSTPQPEYRLEPGQDQLEAVFTWKAANGVVVNKVYSFKRGSYLVGIRYEVRNGSQQPWQGYLYRQLQHSEVVHQSGLGMLPTYTGGVYSGVDRTLGEKVPYEKYDFDDMKERDLNRTLDGGWAAMIQHYFLVALVPGQQESNRFYTSKGENDRYSIGLINAQQTTVAPAASAQFDYQLYIGPKQQEVLQGIAPGLELTVDYGFVTIIAEPLFWLLKWVHKLVGNWGWAIIVVTILLRGAFYPLQSKSYRSMAKMRKVTPRIQQLKERYGDNKQGFQQAMLDLYKTEKVNPFGGCLPPLIQLPIFLAFYWVLLESVELRQADWVLWYTDLSIKDPYYILPILMGITMWVQFKLNPAPTDPMQAKVMMFMPIVLTGLFFFFPAGLVLYWTVSNLLTIVQQYIITREVERVGE